MAFCTDCGGSVESIHDYCYSCGNRIEHREVATNAVVVEGEIESIKPRPVYMTVLKRIGGALLVVIGLGWMALGVSGWAADYSVLPTFINTVLHLVTGALIVEVGWGMMDGPPMGKLFPLGPDPTLNHLTKPRQKSGVTCPSCDRQTAPVADGQCAYCRADLPMESLVVADLR